MLGVHYQLHTHHGGVSKVWQKTTPRGIFYGAHFQNKHPLCMTRATEWGSVALIATF